MDTHNKSISRKRNMTFASYTTNQRSLRRIKRLPLFEDEKTVKKRIDSWTEKLSRAKDKTEKLFIIKKLTKLQTLYFDILRNKNNVTQKEFLEAAEHLSKKMQSAVI